MKRTWIHHAIIVNEGRRFAGSVVIEGEKIQEVIEGDGAPAAVCDEQIDAQGCFLLPGVIDDHVHFRDPGLTHKADMATETAAAAAGGVTSFMDMPNCNPQTTTLEALENKFKDAATKCIVNYSFYFGATNNNADQLASTGNMLVDRMEALKKIFSEAGMLIATHCEDQQIIRENTERFKQQYGEDLDISFHPLIRSEEACYHSSALAVQLAKETGARLHILHISTARELGLLEDRPLHEKKITAEACVSHLMFCDEDYAQFGARIKCNPSIKTKADREALQFSLVSIYELVHEGILSIEQLVQKMCHAPAQLYQISQRGFIRPGYQADLVLLNPHKEWTVTTDCIESKCGWSPMEGRTFHAQVEKTFVNGTAVYENGKVNKAHRGQALRFER